jgi:hypothetical protein
LELIEGRTEKVNKIKFWRRKFKEIGFFILFFGLSRFWTEAPNKESQK